jgi:hypothetical protein
MNSPNQLYEVGDIEKKKIGKPIKAKPIPFNSPIIPLEMMNVPLKAMVHPMKYDIVPFRYGIDEPKKKIGNPISLIILNMTLL